jgi:hypothetical protein
MEGLYDDLLGQIDKGLKGKTAWVPIGFPKMGEHIGIGKGIYTIIGGNPGTGKTAMADLAYVLNPYDWWYKNKNNTDVKIKWIYRSMERPKVYKLAKWVSVKLFKDCGLLLDVSTILGWGSQKNKISTEIYEKIKQCRDYFEEMLDYIELVDGSINPTGIYKHVYDYATRNGEIQVIEQKLEDGRILKHKKYIPKDDNLITVIMEDHLGKLKGESNDGIFLQPQSKQLLDKMSDYNGSEFRDFFGFSPVAVIQFNRSLEDVTRRTKTELGPLPGDFKGSGNMYEDADIALGLFNPWKFKDNEHMGYNIPKMVTSGGYNRFRSITVLKNSYGIDDAGYGLFFLGENGFIGELKRADLMSNEDYEKIINLR